MKICIVAEGCYPYSVGGMSSWVDGLIRSFPEQEFIILAIVANRSQRGKFACELPENVTEVHELYLDDADWGRRRRRKSRMSREEYQALRSLLLGEQVEWERLFDFFQKKSRSLNDLLMGEDFLSAVTEYYKLNYSQIVFTDFLWTMRSIYLPLFVTLQMEIPKADLYHCLSTGYAGILGSMAKYIHGGRLMISEHGIYTREREEELIRSDWVEGIYKNIWIEQFYKMSSLAYERADLITSLYEEARKLQLELSCPVEKTMVTSNGISVERFANLPGKTQEDEGKINVGAVVRIAQIKDIKTMIQAFAFAREWEPSLKLWIMGPWKEEEEYARECFELAEVLGITDIVFTGEVDVREYYGRMDMTLLTSISEGQPLTIMESLAAHKPVIATDVGNCKGLLLGENDDFGEAGIITHIMNVEEIARAMVKLARDERLRLEMGENGYKRVTAGYRFDQMQKTYRNIYKDFADSMWLVWEEKTAQPPLEQEPEAAGAAAEEKNAQPPLEQEPKAAGPTAEEKNAQPAATEEENRTSEMGGVE